MNVMRACLCTAVSKYNTSKVPDILSWPSCQEDHVFALNTVVGIFPDIQYLFTKQY